ncbi:MAG: hypothetical protein OEQ13_10165 [Acidobacteriota bacterium]|nr:hypothetical protein [Acidobacteriota bacterium]
MSGRVQSLKRIYSRRFQRGLKKIGSFFMRAAIRRLPYGVVVALSRWCCSVRLFQRLFFRKDVQELDYLLSLADPSADRRSAIRRHLMGTSLHFWRMWALDTRPWPALQDHFPVRGRDKLDRALAAGRPVIVLNSHFGGARAIPTLLAVLRYRVTSLEGGDVMESMGIEPSENLSTVDISNTFPARVIAIARRALKEGRVIHMLGDGYAGDSGFPVGFLGRTRQCRTGFAELAVGMSADVIPVLAPIDGRGRALVQFYDPLDSGDPGLSRAERVDHLIRQYFLFLERHWRRDPGNAQGLHIQKLRLQSSPLEPTTAASS